MLAPIYAVPFSGTAVASERTELRVRDSGAGLQADAETAASLRLTLHGRHLEVGLNAFPRFTAFSFADSARDAFVASNGAFVLGWRERRWGMFLSQDGGYGFENFATLRFAPVDPLPGTPPGTPPIPTTPSTLPGTDTLTTVNSRSALSAYQNPRNRWLVSEAAAFDVAGGSTKASQAFLPLIYGPRANVAADYRFAPIDHIGFVVDGSYQIFSTGSEIGVGTAELRYRHDLPRHSSLTFGAGPSAAVIRRLATDARETHPYMTADVGLSHRRGFLGARLAVDAVVRFAPVVDRIAAVVDPRLSATLEATWTARRITVLLGLAGAQSVFAPSSQGSITFVSGNATLRFPVARTVDLEGGTRAAVQSFGGGVFTSYAFFFAVNLHTPVLHFRTE